MKLSDIPRNPDRSTLRNFGLLCVLFFGGLAALRIWRNGPSTVLWTVLALGCLAGIVGIAAPSLLRWIFVGWMYLVFPIGWVVSHVALGLLYLLVFAPLGLVFRIIGRDRLNLRHNSGGSYWTPKPSAEDPAAYFKQF